MPHWLDMVASRFGMIALYVAACLEAAGLPIPYELVFLGFGLLVEAGEAQLSTGLMGLYAANLLGNLAGYGFGRLFGRRLLPLLLRRSRPLRQLWYQRRSTLQAHVLRALLTMRWIGFGFGPTLWLAGLQRTPISTVMLTMALVNAVWVAIWGTLAREIMDWIINLRQPSWALATTLAVVAAILVARRLWRERSARTGSEGNR